MKEYEKIARLQLIRSPSIGAVRFRKLINVYGSAINALEILPAIFKNSKKNKDFQVYSKDLAIAEIEKADKQDINIIFYGDEFFPASLGAIQSESPVLFVKTKNLSALKNINGVSIVGTRNSSLIAEKFCFNLSKELANDGYCVVSGMALGIDASAHKGALDSKSGFPTVAVLAGGVDVIYPQKNRFLYDEIIEKGGMIISEMQIGVEPAQNLFPVRNKIIAGLSRGVIVVEAKSKSGSLITAEYARDYKKIVMAVPGFPSDERAGGPNKLLKSGAYLIENIGDVKKALINVKNVEDDNDTNLFIVSENKFENIQDIEDIKKSILYKLSKVPVPIEDLIESLGVDTKIVLRAVLELELQDLVECSGGTISLL